MKTVKRRFRKSNTPSEVLDCLGAFWGGHSTCPVVGFRNGRPVGQRVETFGKFVRICV